MNFPEDTEANLSDPGLVLPASDNDLPDNGFEVQMMKFFKMDK
jgi:hypothetical protein